MVQGQSKRKYTGEYRESAVGLVLAQGLEQAAGDLGMPENTLRVWVSQARRGGGSRGDGV